MTDVTKRRQWLPAISLFLVALAATLCLESDASYFLVWWLIWTTSGLIFWPLAARFIPTPDGGFALAKILGPMLITLAVSGLCTSGILPFTQLSLIALFIAAAILVWGLPQLKKDFVKRFSSDINPHLIIAEELIFALLLLLWTFARGLKPELGSLEKMMNIGFINSLWRSDTLPALDMWFAGGTINYYYGGHILAAVMMKISNIQTQVSYNLSLATTMALTGCLSFSLGYNVLQPHFRKKKRCIPWISGGLASLLVSFGGNGHSFWYDPDSPAFPLLQKIAQLLPSETGEIGSFWFADSTRYIGHNPPIEDFTIHEFPYYSFLVADLHAHLLNLASVLGLLIILVALWQSGWLSITARHWERKLLQQMAGDERVRGVRLSLALSELKTSVFDYRIWLLSAILAFFMMTNYWDFIIYFALIAWLSWMSTHGTDLPLISLQGVPVIIIQILLVLIPFLLLRSPWLTVFALLLSTFVSHLLLAVAADRICYAACKATSIFALGHLPALTFNLHFSAISKTIKLTDRHTSLYQFLVVWGVMICAGLIWWLTESISGRKRKITADKPDQNSSQAEVNEPQNLSEWRSGRVLLVSLLAAALILLLIPEIIYVQDIYGAAYQRSNTMFKFTYQAFVLLMIVWGVGLARLLTLPRNIHAKIAIIVLTIFIIVPLWYPFAATEQWLGEFNKENYQTLDGTVPLRSKDSPQISGENGGELRSYFELIDWINENIEGQPVIVEAVSVSYSDYNLVSAFTGLPTVVGWPTHEWLWRQTQDNPDAWSSTVGPRVSEVRQVYQDCDRDLVKDILRKYRVQYIVIGALERSLYSDDSETPVPNELFLRSLGTAVFDRDGTTLVCVKSFD